MANNVNKVMLIGRLGSDPEIRYTSGGQPRCSMRVATSRRYKEKGKDEWTEKTCWHRVIAWGKQGEFCKQYLSRGRLVYVEGRLENYSYTGKDGQQKYMHEVVSDNVVFLESRKDRPAPTFPSSGSAEAASAPPVETQASSIDDQDLPF